MKPKQAEINIGMVGHVDHGKTTLTQALTGKFTDYFSEEVKRGISIRLGYADAIFYKDSSKEGIEAYTNKKCKTCEVLRRVSFVDSPGHESLMATTISGAAIMDGAILVIAANEKCPQPQTIEHFRVLDISGIENLIIVQNKIDLVKKEDAIKNYEQIKDFISGTRFENAPIIPVAANHKANLDALIYEIEKTIPTPKRDLSKPFRMSIARSFDINKPGDKVSDLKGGAIGGSILQGVVKVGDEIEIGPIKTEKGWKTINTKVMSLYAEKDKLDEAKPGGLISIGTLLDPAVTRGDMLVGKMVGKPGTLPPMANHIEVDVTLLKRVVGKMAEMEMKPLEKGELIAIGVSTTITVGTVENVKKNQASIALKAPIMAEEGMRIVISRRLGGRWGLSGYGTIKNYS